MQTRHAVLRSYVKEMVSPDPDGMYGDLGAHTIAIVISQSSKPLILISIWFPL